MEYHDRLRFRGSPFAFQIKPRICILCSCEVQNLNIFCKLFNKAVWSGAAAAMYFFQRFAARMRRLFSKCFCSCASSRAQRNSKLLA